MSDLERRPVCGNQMFQHYYGLAIRRNMAREAARDGGVCMTSPVAHPSTIPARLRYLAWVMGAIGIDMEYYGGFGPMANHGQELLKAASVARTWADNIEWLSGSQYAGEAEEPEDEV